jgi:hypothetical protein
VAEVDNDQLAALRRLRAAFGFVIGEPPAQALDDLMRKLLVVHRLLEAEERLAKRRPRAEPL